MYKSNRPVLLLGAMSCPNLRSLHLGLCNKQIPRYMLIQIDWYDIGNALRVSQFPRLSMVEVMDVYQQTAINNLEECLALTVIGGLTKAVLPMLDANARVRVSRTSKSPIVEGFLQRRSTGTSASEVELAFDFNDMLVGTKTQESTKETYEGSCFADWHGQGHTALRSCFYA
ncbi:hypothetical protein CYLTODRAFT_279779 [Cylindrobasidium torrendii FP15055 ss-10]|uniref:Uncharacterized protein n=1 Tax=Cylindrobasidium torrendii FP15055 ss-10 TaxID=1314674 RepID=A0A0D7BDZ9_9AGAR|nr:hypothetical protein CYLTODRAFT_279779 [Cylindrobasidium torrendii FP15055 ss-10]